MWLLPPLQATKVSAATLLNAFKTIERRVATLMKTGCTRTASCLSVTGHGAPLCQCATLFHSTGVGVQVRGKNKLRRRRRRSPCLTFVIAMVMIMMMLIMTWNDHTFFGKHLC